MTDNETIDLRLKVTEERLRGSTMGPIRKAQSGDIVAMMEMLSRYMTDENGKYLSEDESYEILDLLTFGDLEEAMGQLEKALENAAAPKA